MTDLPTNNLPASNNLPLTPLPPELSTPPVSPPSPPPAEPKKTDEEITAVNVGDLPSGKSKKSKILLAVLGLLFILASTPLAVYLVKQRQEVRKEAEEEPTPPIPLLTLESEEEDTGVWQEVEHDGYPGCTYAVDCDLTLYPTDDGWIRLTYDDSSWKEGYAVKSWWWEQEDWNCKDNLLPDIPVINISHPTDSGKFPNINRKTGLYRKKFQLSFPENAQIAEAKLDMFSDNKTAVYINEHLVVSSQETCYSTSVDTQHFHAGENILAIQLSNDEADSYNKDNPMGLAYKLEIKFQAPPTVTPTPTGVPTLPPSEDDPRCHIENGENIFSSEEQETLYVLIDSPGECIKQLIERTWVSTDDPPDHSGEMWYNYKISGNCALSGAINTQVSSRQYNAFCLGNECNNICACDGVEREFNGYGCKTIALSLAKANNDLTECRVEFRVKNDDGSARCEYIAEISPTPTPGAGLTCVDLTKDKETPEINDQITFACTADPRDQIDHFNFRYQIDNGEYIYINNVIGSSGGPTVLARIDINIDTTGSWHVQCQVCPDETNTNCTQWGEAQ